MSFFRTINKIEDGVRRDVLSKEGTEEKMGVPVKMGIHGDRDEEQDDAPKGELMNAINIYGAAARGGVKKEPPPQEDIISGSEVSQDAVKGEACPVESNDDIDYEKEEEDDLDSCVTSKDVYGRDADEEIKAWISKSDEEALSEAGDDEPDEMGDAEEGGDEDLADGGDAGEDMDEEAEEVDVGEENEEVVDDQDDLQDAGDDQGADIDIGGDEEVNASFDMSDIEKTKRKPASRGKGKKPAPKGAAKIPPKSAKKPAKKDEPDKAAAGKGFGKEETGKPKKRKAKAKKPSSPGRARGPEGYAQPKDVYGKDVNVKSFGRSTKGREKRQRRHPGEIWWGKYGVGRKPETMVAWTKHEDSNIVRVKKTDPEFKKLQESAKKGLKPGQSYLPPGVDAEHKRHATMSERFVGWRPSSHVKIIQSASSRGKRMTAESEAAVLQILKESGVKFSKEQIANGFRKRFLDELAGHKMNLGKPSKWARTPAQVRRDFIEGMDASNYANRKEFDAARNRVNKMSPEQFEAMQRAIALEDDEDGSFAAAAAPKGKAKVGKSFESQLEDILKSMRS